MEETSSGWGFTLQGGAKWKNVGERVGEVGLVVFFPSGEDGTGPRGLEVLGRYLSQREPWKAGISTYLAAGRGWIEAPGWTGYSNRNR